VTLHGIVGESARTAARNSPVCSDAQSLPDLQDLVAVQSTPKHQSTQHYLPLAHHGPPAQEIAETNTLAPNRSCESAEVSFDCHVPNHLSTNHSAILPRTENNSNMDAFAAHTRTATDFTINNIGVAPPAPVRAAPPRAGSTCRPAGTPAARRGGRPRR
jgi:hypothetical protein